MCFSWSEFEVEFQKKLSEILDRLLASYKKIYASRIHPDLFGDMTVTAYGEHSRLMELANIQILSARSISIRPYDSGLLEEIDKSIKKHFPEFRPIVQEGYIRISLNSPTEESRKKTVKEAKDFLEHARVHVRNLRKEYMHKIKKNELPEDQEKKYSAKLDQHVKEINLQLEKIFLDKEKELMTI